MHKDSPQKLKLTLEIEPSSEDLEKGVLEATTNAVGLIRSFLTFVKEEYGIKVPALALRRPKGHIIKSKSPNTKRLEFVNTLLDYHKKFNPEADLSAQARAVQQLYDGGETDAAKLIKLYDECKAEYTLTTWYTVRHRITKGSSPTEADTEFKRRELTDHELKELEERIRSYGQNS